MALVLTTSRRTNAKQEQIIKDLLAACDIESHIIIANENNPDYAVNGILGLSDIVIVSSESISMASEAVASEKPVIVYKGKKKIKSKSKYEFFLDNLEKLGCLKQVDNLNSLNMDDLIQNIKVIDSKQYNENFSKAMERLKI